MATRTQRYFLSAIVAAVLLATPALAQGGGDASLFVRFLENLLSTPERRVSLGGLEGVFSSQPRFERITISDSDGPWLEMEAVEVVWNRSALFSRVLDIDSLKAGRVAMLRRPAPPEAAEEGEGFGAPPLSVVIDAFSLPRIELAEAVVGGAAELAAAGSARITEEALAARLTIDRQDRAGTLTADLRLEPRANVLNADLTVEEPAGGLLAELLGLRGRPAAAITLSGAGPLAEWRADLAMQANGERVLEGDLAVDRIDGVYRVSGNLGASLEAVAPADYAALLAGESRLSFAAELGGDSSITVRSATLRSAGMDLAASGVLAADMVPRSADVSLTLGQAGRARLPFAPGEPSVASLRATATLGSGAKAAWRADISAEGVEAEFGVIDEIVLHAAGSAEDLAQPEARRTSFSVEGAAGGVALADPAWRQAIGATVRVTGSGAWAAGQPTIIESLQTVLSGAAVSFAGTAAENRLNGRFGATVAELSRFAALADRTLSGGAQINASGTAGLDGTFALQLEGATDGLALGIATVDLLLAGETRIDGGLAQEAGRLGFDRFVLSNDRATAQLDGALADPEIDLSVNASLADLSLLAPRAAGAARITAKVSGTSVAPHIEAVAAGEDVVLMDRPLADAVGRFSGIVSGPDTAGEAEISGMLDGSAVTGSARLAAGEGGLRLLEDLLFSVGDSRVAGDLRIGSDGLLSGALDVASPDLSTVAPLFLVEASGMLRAHVTLSADNGAQSATFSGSVADIVYEEVTVASADVEGTASNLFSAPLIEGDFVLRNLVAGGLSVRSAEGSAERRGRSTLISVDADLPDGRAVLAGTIEPRDGGLAIALDNLLFSRSGIDLALAAPAALSIRDGIVALDSVRLQAGGGSATLTGRAGSTLDLDIQLDSVPAALANSFSPGLGAEGSVSGAVRVSGRAPEPAARFDLRATGASVAASRNAGLGPLSVSAVGDLANRRTNVQARIEGADGLAVRVAGAVGTAAGAAVDLSVVGAVPLSLGNRRLADRGAALQGALSIDINVSGTVSDPRFSGRVTSEGGGFVDPETGIVLSNLALAASVSADRLVIDRLNARSGEGTVSATGSIGLDANAGFPIDVALQVSQARYVDGTLLASRFDANLTVTGNLADGPLLQGNVFLDRTEVTVPERLPHDSVAVDVEHVAAPPSVRETVALARNPERSGGGGRTRGGLRLNLTIGAPQQIFVRGRGLDTELGGEVRLTGAVSSLVTSGAFDMVRGRLDILTQRIVFDRGIVTFAGDLDPILDFIGTTRSGDTTITVTVSGRASDPEVYFSSIPELPQDEVLARLIFQKGLGELSPVQIARLAGAAAELSGGSGGGILSQLRKTTGLDDLDIVTDEEGAPAVAAGRYVSENVYVGVQQGTSSESTRVTIDLDITDNVKARAGVSPSGGSSLGVFYEREY